MKNPTRVVIATHVSKAFDDIYSGYLKNGYDHLQALKKTRDEILDIAEGEVRARTDSTTGFWEGIGQRLQNVGEMVDLDNQLNALVVQNL
jgi:hypothetical protein